jgi:hypothetical protein
MLNTKDTSEENLGWQRKFYWARKILYFKSNHHDNHLLYANKPHGGYLWRKDKTKILYCNVRLFLYFLHFE